MVFLTVFTPTYNRIHTLARTYESLCHQTCMDFLWLIIDDGSTDDTAVKAAEWQKISPFEIQYMYKKNGGMHTAHNTAYEHIRTELNMCLDSDDCLDPDAVRIIKETWNKVKEQGYGGMIGLDADMKTDRIIGKGFLPGIKDTTLGGYYACGGAGDKKLIYRTNIMQDLPPYPVFEGENYVGLAYKYILADQKCRLYIIDEVLCRVDYQSDGSSKTMWQQYYKNPKGFACYRKLAMMYPRSYFRMLIDCIHYCSSSIIAGNSQFIRESPRKIWTIVCTPMGLLLTLMIHRKVHVP